MPRLVGMNQPGQFEVHLVAHRYQDGERAVMLVDDKGMPLAWPALFVTSQLRNAGQPVNTIRRKLDDIRVLLRWEFIHGRDLMAEMATGQYPTFGDLLSIRDFTAKRSKQVQQKVTRISGMGLLPARRANTVSPAVHYSRLTTIAYYLRFAAEGLTGGRASEQSAKAIDRMATRLLKHRPAAIARRATGEAFDRSPPAERLEAFVEASQEGNADNPFRVGSIQRRNELMVRLVYETGIRRGELLSLRIDAAHLHGEEPTIKVVRTHDDRLDPRANQPTAKTKEDLVSISPELAVEIWKYITGDRASTPGANKHPYLFVVHRRGLTCGRPISLAACGKIIAAIQGVRSDLSGIHIHSFRHNRNYLLSKYIQEHNRRVRADGVGELILPEREADIRAFMNRHRSNESGRTYNERHVREMASRVVRDLQEGFAKPKLPIECGDNG